ncbi:MAG: tetratricopeptide repeat protein [Planctomycetota bacterium]|nr:tetratricopeptide repeat protein [Planctomycetota bacterium]
MSKRLYPERSISMPLRPDDLSSALKGLFGVPGWKNYRAGELAAAIAWASRRLSVEPNDGRAWELLGLAYRDSGDIGAAVDAFERATMLVVLHPLSRVCLTECYAVQKRYELARDLYLTQADEGTGDSQLLLLIAAGLEGINEPQLAMDICRRAGELDPGSGQAMYDLCFYAMRCGCTASLAESLAWKAVELDPGNVEFRIGLASILIRLDRIEKAMWVLRYLAKSQFQNVNCVCCLERIATLYEAVGEAEGMRRVRSRLLEVRVLENELPPAQRS